MIHLAIHAGFTTFPFKKAKCCTAISDLLLFRLPASAAHALRGLRCGALEGLLIPWFPDQGYPWLTQSLALPFLWWIHFFALNMLVYASQAYRQSNKAKRVALESNLTQDLLSHPAIIPYRCHPTVPTTPTSHSQKESLRHRRSPIHKPFEKVQYIIWMLLVKLMT